MKNITVGEYVTIRGEIGTYQVIGLAYAKGYHLQSVANPDILRTEHEGKVLSVPKTLPVQPALFEVA